jgi:hypothetical protein
MGLQEISFEIDQHLIWKKPFQKSLKNCFQGPKGGQLILADWLLLFKKASFVLYSFYYFFLAL